MSISDLSTLDLPLRIGITTSHSSGIYYIVNLINGKFYIGRALNLQRRQAFHFRCLRSGTHHNIGLQRAFSKYGERSFEFRIIKVCPQKRLESIEQAYLDQHVGKLHCYNISKSSHSPVAFGQKMRPEQTEKKRAIMRRPETREKVSKATIKRLQNPDFRAKHLEACRNPVTIEKWRLKLLAALAKPEYRKKREKVWESISKPFSFKNQLTGEIATGIGVSGFSRERFPDCFRTAQVHLNDVTLGKRKSYKGWYIYPDTYSPSNRSPEDRIRKNARERKRRKKPAVLAQAREYQRKRRIHEKAARKFQEMMLNMLAN